MPTISRIITALAAFSLATVLGADLTPPGLPPLPSELPSGASSPAATLPSPVPNPNRPVIIHRPRPNIRTPSGTFQGFTNARPGMARPTYKAPGSMSDSVISWDAISKEYDAKPGDLAANFSFSLTNVSKSNVVINWVKPSCGCTVAKLPPTPWTLAPGEAGTIDFSVDLRGKFGTLSKYVSVDSSAGQKLLSLKIVIPTTPVEPGMASRSRNMQMAMADRQAVFRGDCARCHVTPTVGKKGGELYTTACAICHEAPHRATMVPDLRAIKTPTGKEFWTQWISNGKPGSLMPAFASTSGGPLNDEQIQSLAEFLTQHFPSSAPTASSGGTEAAAARN